METLSDNIKKRYIKLTTPSPFSIENFIKIPLYTFHEYISHLCASTYMGPLASEQQRKEAIASYEKIPWELDEGWMVYVAKEFLVDKKNTALYDKCPHLQDILNKIIDNWYIDMVNPYGGKSYISQAERGAQIAGKFLRFLLNDVYSKDDKKAYNVYYSFSFDLIRRYISPEFEHLEFIAAIDALCKRDKDYSIPILQRALDEKGEFINIEVLWQHIKILLPKSSLNISYEL